MTPAAQAVRSILGPEPSEKTCRDVVLAVLGKVREPDGDLQLVGYIAASGAQYPHDQERVSFTAMIDALIALEGGGA